ncbi:class I SAM-dependent RNA methyltransferase [Pontivivens insulae]|nr:class I SAM-dependent RNA methyltransferase [Pontivivens insulae]
MTELTISKLGHRGDGIGRDAIGTEHFVPFTLPGERVLADPLRVLDPSVARVTPPCPQFGSCGGCVVQHASDDFVADWKVGIVRTALEAQGLPAPIAGIATSPEASRRRATFAGRRTKKTVSIGFHERASDRIVPVTGCRTVAPAVLATLPALEALVHAGASRKATLRLTVTASEAGPDIAVEGGKPTDPELVQTLLAIASDHDVARLSWSDETLATFRSPTQTFGPARVVPPAGAFLQATEHGQAALIAAVSDVIGDANRVVDLFAGCGTFTLPLAVGADVLALESEAPMLAALDAGWRGTPGLRKIVTKTRDLFRNPVPGANLRSFDAAVIDPPRAGALAQTEALAESGIPKVAAVSCNPVTFARDAAVLVNAGYSLDRVLVIDQFRWAAHVELVAAFSR